MKFRKVAVVLLSALLVGLAGCGQEEGVTSVSAESSVSSEQISSEMQESSEASDSAEASDTTGTVEQNGQEGWTSDDRDALDLLGVLCERKHLNQWDDSLGEYGMDTAYVDYNLITLSEEDAAKYPKLSEALARMNLSRVESFQENFTRLSEDAGYYREQMGPEQCSIMFPLFDKDYFSVARADERVLSLRSDYSGYGGGAHGYYAAGGYNLDTATGKILTWEDVFTDVNRIPEIVDGLIEDKYDTEYFFVDVEQYLRESLQQEEMTISWLIDYTGVTIYFNPYEIASYADGLITAKISFAEYPDLFNPYYTEVPTAYAVGEIQDSFSERYWDVDGDGRDETIRAYVTASCDEEGAPYDAITIGVNDHEQTFDIYGYVFDYYLIHNQDGRSYLYVESMMENDYTSVHLYELKVGEVSLSDEYGGSLSSVVDNDGANYREWILTDPSCFTMDVRTNLLSTIPAFNDVQISPEGKFIECNKEYYYQADYKLTAKKAITGVKTDAAGRETGESVTVNAGEKLSFYSTDLETYVTFRVGDEFVRFYVNWKEWPQTVNGEDIEDLFDDMIFAG